VNISDNIRLLAKEGLSVADIARRLDKRYQHVYNVLKAGRTSSAAHSAAVKVSDNRKVSTKRDGRFVVPDGLEELRDELPIITMMIARSARWVHPDTFHAMPVWFPETARGQLVYDATWGRVYKNKNRETGAVTERNEPNIKAGQALMAALGATKTVNWTVCHIWGVDDPKFGKSNRVVRDHRFYSCVGNMIWLPTPLKGFTDSMPEIKRMLRVCAFHLYGWTCQHPDVEAEAKEIQRGEIPPLYPESWPTRERRCNPPRTAPFSERVQRAITKRKSEIQRLLNNHSLENFPRDRVREVLEFWKIEL
jgi:hypothetical protein